MIRDGVRTFLRIHDYEPGTSTTSPAGSGPSAPSPTATTTIIQQISQAGLTGNIGPQGLRGFTGPTGPMGPQGIQGPAGTSSLASPEFLTQAGFVSKTFFDGQVDRIFDSISNSTRGLSDSLDKEVVTDLLTVSGNATVGGDLNVSGKIALDGTVIAYRPTDMTGTLILGDGGTALSHTSTIEGYYNTFVGLGSGNSNTTGSYNTANGYKSLNSNTTGVRNTANGYTSLSFNTTGVANTANGMQSLNSNTTGNLNTANGYRAGYNTSVLLQTMTNSTFLGNNANSSVDGVTNSTAIGNNAQVTASNQMVLGNTSVTQTLLNGNVGIGTTTPGGLLHLFALAANPDLILESDVNLRIIFKDVTTGNFWFVGSNAASAGAPVDNFGFGITANPAENFLNITTAGNVGIGTTEPIDKLEVNGNIRLTSGSGGQIIFGDGSIMSSAGLGSASSLTNPLDVVVVGDSDMNGTGDIIFKTGNTEKMRMLNNGNIGIGTNAPTANITFGTNGGTINSLGALTINSATTSTLTLDSATTGAVNIGTGLYAKGILIGNNIGATTVSINSGTGTLNLGTNAIAHTVNIGNLIGATAVNINTGTGNFNINTNQFNLVKATGYVGINKTVPAYLLDVNGTINATNILLNGIPVGTSSDSYWSTATGGITYSGGNVGIGTTAPIRVLDVYSPSTNNFNIANFHNPLNAGNYNFIEVGKSSTSGNSAAFGYLNTVVGAAFITVYGDDPLVGTGLFVQKGGNVGIGTTVPAYKLDVSGTVNATALKVNGVDVATSSDSFWSTATGGINYSGGNVGIGTTNAQSLITLGQTDSVISTDSLDGSDNKRIQLSGGGLPTTSRGGYINLRGNEYTGAEGNVNIIAGNSGIAGNGIISFLTGGSEERLRITSTGNVGIGTTTPDGLLHVSGSSSKFEVSNGAVGGSGATAINFTNSNLTNGNTIALKFTSPTALYGSIVYNFENRGVGSETGSTAFWTRNAGGALAESMRISSTGNVGIGTTTPAYPLDVNGAINATSLLVNGIPVGTSSDSYWSTATGGITYGGGNVDVSNGLLLGGGSSGIKIDSSGNVGIGTTEPDAKLHVKDTVANGKYVMVIDTARSDSSNNYGLLIRSDTYANLNTGNLVVQNALGTTFMVSNNGNVGIGTTAPGVKLHIVSTDAGSSNIALGATGTGSAGIIFDASDGDIAGNDYGLLRQNNDLSVQLLNAGANPLNLGVDNSVDLSIISGGNVGIGTTAPGAKLHVYKGAAGGVIIPSSLAGIVIENSDDVSLQLFSPVDKMGMIQFGSSINGAQGRIAYQHSETATTDYMSFDIIGTEKMRIDVNGKLGLGTTTPAQALDLASDNASITLSSITGPHQIITGGTTDLALMPGGKVGIGTTTPTTKLDVVGTVNATGLTINGVPVATSSDTYWNAVAGGISYTAGNVGIGTATPNGLFDVNSKLIVLSGGNVGIGTILPTQVFQVNDLASTAFVVTSAGNVGIGITTPAFPLDVNGDIHVSGNIVFANGSTMNAAGVGSSDALSNAGDAVIWGDSDASSAGDIIFKTNSTEKMRINNAGLLTLSNGSLFGSQISWGTGLGAITHIQGPTDAVFKITSYLTNALTLDSGSTGAINIGTSAFAKTVTIGNATGASSVVLNSGTGAINIGTSIAKTITIGNVTGATSVVLNSGTGAINIGTSIAKIITIGNATGATAVKINTGTGNFAVNTSQLFVDETSGNVGVGTATPTAKLNVNGSVLFSGSTNVTPVDGELVYDTSVHAYKYYDSNAVAWMSLAGGAISSTGSFWTQNGTILSYTAGNVGIGTTDPTAVLQLKAGTIAAGTAPLKLTSGTLNTVAEAGAIEFLTDKFYGTITTGAARKTFAFLESPAFTTPNIGAGTGTGLALTSANTTQVTTASALVLNANSLTTGTGVYIASSKLTSGLLVNLQVSGTTAAASQTALNILTAGANATTAITTYGAQISNTHTNATAGTNIALYLNASGATTANYGLIVDSGSVGIGTTTPTELLDVRGNIYTPAGNAVIVGNTFVTSDVIIGTSATSGLTIRASEAAGYLSFQTGGSNSRMRIDNAGNVGIGTTTPTYKLSVSDTTTAGIVGSFTNSDGTCTLDPGDIGGWSCPSDEKLKKDIVNLDSGLAQINQLRPVSYRLKNEDESVMLSMGLLAQEVQPIFPKLVTTQLDGTLSLNYGGLTPIMVKAIQELDIKINDLSATLVGTANAGLPAEALAKAGLFFSDIVQKVEGGVAYMKGLVVDTLKIGSPTKRTGITLYDEITGDPYCLSIANGVTKTTPGECVIIEPTSMTANTLETATGTDTIAPVITLNSTTPINLAVGDSYVEERATAIDDTDGDTAVIISGSVDTATDGTYTITYTATDTAGNSATATRTVIVGTGIAPTPSTETSTETPSETPTCTAEQTLVDNVCI